MLELLYCSSKRIPLARKSVSPMKTASIALVEQVAGLVGSLHFCRTSLSVPTSFRSLRANGATGVNVIGGASTGLPDVSLTAFSVAVYVSPRRNGISGRKTAIEPPP